MDIIELLPAICIALVLIAILALLAAKDFIEERRFEEEEREKSKNPLHRGTYWS